MSAENMHGNVGPGVTPTDLEHNNSSATLAPQAESRQTAEALPNLEVDHLKRENEALRGKITNLERELAGAKATLQEYALEARRAELGISGAATMATEKPKEEPQPQSPEAILNHLLEKLAILEKYKAEIPDLEDVNRITQALKRVLENINNYDVTRERDLTELTQHVFIGTSPISAVLETIDNPTLNQAVLESNMLNAQLQTAIARLLKEKYGLEKTRTPRNTPYNPQAHTSGNLAGIPVNNPELHNRIYSVMIPGLSVNGIPVQKALVQRYIYNQPRQVEESEF